MYDRKDYQAFVEANRTNNSNPTHAIMAHQAAVSMDRLTNHPDWDKYLTMIQGKREELVDELESHISDLKTAQHLGTENLQYHHTMIYALTNQISSLEWAMDLPSQIIGSDEGW